MTDKVTDTSGKDPRLPGARSCQDQEWALEVLYSFPLLGVESRKVGEATGSGGRSVGHPRSLPRRLRLTAG
jgi:hypothetical protein